MLSKIPIPDPILPALLGLWLIAASVVVDLVGIGNPARFGRSQTLCLVGGVILLVFALVLLHRTASREARSGSRSYGKTLSVALTGWVFAAVLPIVVIEGAARLSVPVEQELDYRVFDPVLGWSLVPDRQYHIKSVRKDIEYTLRIDRNGFRDDGQQIGSVGDARVVVLGDSNAFGVGLPDDKVLSHQLHDALLTRGVDVKVLNAGVPGYGLDQFLLRLRSLGKLAAGTVVVLLIHPMNDLVNLSSDVDYSTSRPATVIQGGRLQFLPPSNRLIVFPAHFSPMFSDLNRVFELPEPHAYPVRSAAVSMVRGERRFRLGPPRDAVIEQVDTRSQSEAMASVWRGLEQSPLFNASRVWTEIRQFESERKTLATLVDALLAETQEHARSCGCRILGVLAPEPDRMFAHSKAVMDRIVELNPQFDFVFGTSRNLLQHSFSRSRVHYVPIEYSADEAEGMFLKNDGHTWVPGMQRIAEAVAAHITEQAWLPGPTASTRLGTR
jgi:lysophospholipase L1-like esterase